MEELNYKELYNAYSTKGRNPDVEPKDLFKILIYAYMNDIYLSRKIETACKRDINFIWLLQGQNSPDHCAIARFRTERLKDGIIDNLFGKLFQKTFNTVSWYDRGPHECYSDRKTGVAISRYNSTVRSMEHQYMRPPHRKMQRVAM